MYVSKMYKTEIYNFVNDLMMENLLSSLYVESVKVFISWRKKEKRQSPLVLSNSFLCYICLSVRQAIIVWR